ncbi:MAG: trypsin-like peptidase domain-containing protein [bacterium]|nr:trypsin-like peptidase domain-containing protein [bacterium]
MNRIYTILISTFLLLAAATQASNFQNQILSARDKVMPALVHIQPIIKNYNTGELEKQAVIGSGIIFHPDGYVVTNYHVAGKAERIICTLEDKELVPAEYIGGDPMTDLAVIKLDLSKYTGTIHVAEFGDSDTAEVGQYVLAMGSPLSLSRSLSAGVISTRDRYFGSDVRLPSGEQTGRYNLWLQTDAAINPGNSGGPLVDMQGRVIGINSRATLFANNIGFAIPVNIVKKVTSEILDHGKVVRSWIGLHCQALQELEGYFGTGRDNGVLVSSIDPGSPAAEAFLKAGDVILEFNGEPVSARFLEELPLFYDKIASLAPGSEVALKLVRGDEEFSFTVTTRELGDLQGEIFECKGWGISVKHITRQMQVENNLKDSLGVFVEGVKRSADTDDGGLRRGDIIKSVDRQQVANLGEFITVYQRLTGAETKKIFVTVDRSGATRFVVLNADEIKEEENES